jgi:uncharacterized phage protein (TIGR01671 family)
MEIKFRAWDKKFNKMEFDAQNCRGEYECYWCFGDYLKNTDQFILMQFTGLKDCNGKEIYDGDILKIKDGRVLGKVYYDVDETCYYIDGKEDCDFLSEWVRLPKMLEAIGNIPPVEIIGNIYENAELLK